MKPVIIATSNPDKFNQISKILSSLELQTNKFLSLADLDINNDQNETGSMLERAKQKALFCLSKIKPENLNQYLCIVANDTGTHLPTLNIETEESKKIASQILAGELIKPSDPINYVYTYAFILLPSQKLMTATAEVPFTYLGNPKNITLEEGKNTMNLVKAIPGQTVPHNQIPESEVISYRLQFLRQALNPIIEEINQI